MSLQRIILTSKELREFKPTVPVRESGLFNDVLATARSGRHATPHFAVGVAIDLLGLDLVRHFLSLPAGPEIVLGWTASIEQHGWGPDLKPIDLQTNLILNAIKATVVNRGLSDLQQEGEAYKQIQRVADESHPLNHALVQSLILNKGLGIPWSLTTHVGRDGSYGVFGIPDNG